MHKHISLVNSEVIIMAQPTTNDTSYFFLFSDKYIIGTPSGMNASDRTIDMPFQDLAENYDLQVKLKLVSAVLIHPDMRPPVAYPMVGRELHQAVAWYLSSFAGDHVKQQQREDYLLNNGLVRILITDEALRQEVMPTLKR
jgi:hypothetical protein